MIKPETKEDCLGMPCSRCEYNSTGCPDWDETKEEREQESDTTINEAADMVNRHYEELLHELFTLGDYIFDLKIEYQDVDGKTISMSWQDRDKRIGWLHGDV